MLNFAKNDQISKFKIFLEFYDYYLVNGWRGGKIDFTIRKSIKLCILGLVLVSLRFIYTWGKNIFLFVFILHFSS